MALLSHWITIISIVLAVSSMSHAGSNITFIQRAIGPRPCRQFIHSTGGRILSQPGRGRYENKLDCKVTIVAPPGQRIFLRIDEFDVADSMNCYQDEVIFYDGRRNSSPQLSGSLYGLCGDTVPEEYRHMVSTGNEVTIRFITDGVSTDNAGFSVSYTAFIPTPKKKDTDKCFQCDEDPMCIDPQLKCDGLNNCVDGSDEKEEMCFVGHRYSNAEPDSEPTHGWLTWPGTVIAIVAVVCYVIGITINCAFNCSRTRSPHTENMHRTVTRAPTKAAEDPTLRLAMLPTVVGGSYAVQLNKEYQFDRQSTCHTHTTSSMSAKTFPQVPPSPRGLADGSYGRPVTNEFLLPPGYIRPNLPTIPQGSFQEVNPRALVGYITNPQSNTQWSSAESASTNQGVLTAPSERTVSNVM